MVRFTGTLSPITLLPGLAAVARVMSEGQQQTESIAPALQATLKPFGWVAERG